MVDDFLSQNTKNRKQKSQFIWAVGLCLSFPVKADIPQIGFICKEVLSRNLVCAHLGLKPLVFFLTGKQQMPENYEPGSGSGFSGLLLGCCWRCKNWHGRGAAPNAAGRGLDITASLNLFFAIFSWQSRSPGPPIGMDTATRLCVCVSLEGSLNRAALLCLAWLLTQRDEAKVNELDKPGRQNTAQAAAFIIAGGTLRSQDHVSQRIYWTLASSFHVHWHLQHLHKRFLFPTTGHRAKTHHPVRRWAHLGAVNPGPRWEILMEILKKRDEKTFVSYLPLGRACSTSRKRSDRSRKTVWRKERGSNSQRTGSYSDYLVFMSTQSDLQDKNHSLIHSYQDIGGIEYPMKQHQQQLELWYLYKYQGFIYKYWGQSPKF